MNNKNRNAELLRWKDLSCLWPAVKGSLALVRKPCIHPGCKACARGEKHPSYIFSYMKGGKKYCMYVPMELVVPLRRAIKNGRTLEELMKQTGPALIHTYRRERTIRRSPKKRRGQLR